MAAAAVLDMRGLGEDVTFYKTSTFPSLFPVGMRGGKCTETQLFKIG